MSDPEFGVIVIERTDHGRTVRVWGEAIPTASITRTGGAQMRGDVPIGTRNPRLLHLELGGRTYDLAPAAGRLTRRSYRATVSGHGHQWLFVPTAGRSHRLLRDEHDQSAVELGVFTAGRVTIAAQWLRPPEAGRPPDEHPGSTGADCAMGYVLAASFGTNARGMLMAIFAGTVDILIPG